MARHPSAMRRPTLCCDTQSISTLEEHNCREHQGGTLSRVRRLFFPSSTSRKSSGCSSPSFKTSPLFNDSAANEAPHLLLSHPLGVVLQQMVGTEVQELGRTMGRTSGVPTILHQLTTYILNHDMNIACLLFEDFDPSDMLSALTSDLRSKKVESSLVAALLRHLVQELPQPLLPHSTFASLTSLAEGHSGQVSLPPSPIGEECKARRILSRDVSQEDLLLIRHFTEFLSCLHHSNRCELEGASVLLSCLLVGGSPSVRCVGKGLAVYFLSHQGAIFKGDTNVESMSPPNDVRTSSNDDSSSSSSRSSSSTSGDTEDYKSPELSPNREYPIGSSHHQYVLLPEGDLLSPEGELVSSEDSSPEGGQCVPQSSSSTSSGEGDPMDDASSSCSARLDHISPVNPSGVALDDSPPAFCPPNEGEVVQTVPPGDTIGTHHPHLKRKEHVDGGTDDEHDPKVIRSTGNANLSGIGLSFSCDLNSDDNTLLCPSKDTCSRSEDTAVESDCTGLSEPWDSSTSRGNVYSESVDDVYPLYDDCSNIPEIIGESLRSSERTHYLSSADHHSPSPQHHHKKKRRAHRHRKSNKDGGAVCSSSPRDVLSLQSDEEEEEKVSSSLPDSSSNDNEQMPSNNSLSSLLDHNEPVVASTRGRWSLGLHEDDHRSVPFSTYSRYDDSEGSPADNCPPMVASSSPWYSYDAPETETNERRDDSYHSHRFAPSAAPFTPGPTSSSSGSSIMRAVTGKAAVSALHKNISALKKKIRKFEEEFESNYGYKPSHSEKMKHKDIKKYMSDLNKYRKEMKLLREGVADLVSSKVFSFSLLRCQESAPCDPPESTFPSDCLPSPTQSSIPSTSSTIEHQNTLQKVQDRLSTARAMDKRPVDLPAMTVSQMQEEKIALQKALLYYESVHGRPNTRDVRELARPLYDRYRQVKRYLTRAQSRAKENVNELAPIFEEVELHFPSPQQRNSLILDSAPELMQCSEKLMEVKRQRDMEEQEEMERRGEEQEEEDSDKGLEGSDSSDLGKQSSSNSMALSNLHSLPLHELKDRRKEVKEQKKKLRRSLRQFEDRYEREHGHKLAKEDRGLMEVDYNEYKHVKAKLRLLEALIAKKASREYDL